MISFFFNWFVLAANVFAWKKLGRLEAPSLSGALAEGEALGFHHVDAEARKQSSRLGLVFVVLALGFVGLAFVGWTLERSHDHDGGHGRPTSVVFVQQAILSGESSTSERGVPVEVRRAVCTGEGDGPAEGYTHFRCAVILANHDTDDVIVHVLPGDMLRLASSSGVAS